MGEQVSKTTKSVNQTVQTYVSKTYMNVTSAQLPSHILEKAQNSCKFRSVGKIRTATKGIEASLAYSPSRNLIALCGGIELSMEGFMYNLTRIQIFTYPQMRQIKGYFGEHDPQKPLYFIPDTTLLVTFKATYTRITDIRCPLDPTKFTTLQTDVVNHAQYLSNYGYLVTCGNKKGLSYWDIKEKKLAFTLFEKTTFSQFVYDSQRNVLLASALNDNHIWIIDPEHRQLIAMINGPRIGGVVNSYSTLRILSLSSKGYVILRGIPLIYYEGLDSTALLLYRLPDAEPYNNLEFIKEFRNQEFRELVFIEKEGMLAAFGYHGKMICLRLLDDARTDTYVAGHDYLTEMKYLEPLNLFTATSDSEGYVDFVAMRSTIQQETKIDPILSKSAPDVLVGGEENPLLFEQEMESPIDRPRKDVFEITTDSSPLLK